MQNKKLIKIDFTEDHPSRFYHKTTEPIYLKIWTWKNEKKNTVKILPEK